MARRGPATAAPAGAPGAPLVRAWWKRPVEVEDRNDRPDAIYPAPLVHVNRNDRRAGLFSPAIWAATRQGTKDQFDLFPGFGPGEAQGPIVPALPLALYDLGGSGAMTRGGPGAAPLALRIFVETVLSANGPVQQPGAPARRPPAAAPAAVRVTGWRPSILFLQSGDAGNNCRPCSTPSTV